MRSDDTMTRPARHILHNTGMGGDAAHFRGPYASISIDVDNQVLRIHDEVIPGGFAQVAFVAPGAALVLGGFGINVQQLPGSSQYVVSRVPVNIPFTALTTFNFVHNLGYYPMVQIMDSATNEIIDAEIVHNSVNDFTVNFNQVTSGFIIL